MTTSRLVFLDVDGTLLDHQQQLSPGVVNAVRTARAHGHRIFVCSGRSPAEVPLAITDIGFDGIISAGGGFTVLDGRLTAAHTLPHDAVDEITSFFHDHDLEYNLQAFDAVYPSAGLAARLATIPAPSGPEAERRAERLVYRAEAPRVGIAKATFFGERPSTFATVREGLSHRFHVITGTMPQLGSAGGEVSLPGINKGAAIAALATHLDANLANVIAIGDSYNDLEMFDVVGVGIAMGNADDAVKSRAAETTGTVQNDGVVEAFRRHGLL